MFVSPNVPSGTSQNAIPAGLNFNLNHACVCTLFNIQPLIPINHANRHSLNGASRVLPGFFGKHMLEPFWLENSADRE